MEREEDLERIKLEEMYMGTAEGTVVEKRDFQGNFTNCAGFCDGYPADVSFSSFLPFFFSFVFFFFSIFPFRYPCRG